MPIDPLLVFVDVMASAVSAERRAQPQPAPRVKRRVRHAQRGPRVNHESMNLWRERDDRFGAVFVYLPRTNLTDPRAGAELLRVDWAACGE